MKVQWSPYLVVFHPRHHGICRKNPDNGEALVVECESAADYRGITTEPTPPGGVCEHHNAVVARFQIVGHEEASECRRELKHIEKIWCRDTTVDPFNALFSLQNERPIPSDADRCDRATLLRPVFDVGG
jgi:hypothetical protein